MKNFIAVFWRSNPEDKKYGYKTRIQIKAKNENAAIKKAHKERKAHSVYDNFELLDVYEEC